MALGFQLNAQSVKSAKHQSLEPLNITFSVEIDRYGEFLDEECFKTFVRIYRYDDNDTKFLISNEKVHFGNGCYFNETVLGPCTPEKIKEDIFLGPSPQETYPYCLKMLIQDDVVYGIYLETKAKLIRELKAIKKK